MSGSLVHGSGGPSLPRQVEISISILALVAAETASAGRQGSRAECPALDRLLQERGSFHPLIQSTSLKCKRNKEDQHIDKNKHHLEITWWVGRPQMLENSREEKAATFEKEDEAHRCGANVTSGLYKLCFRLDDSSSPQSAAGKFVLPSGVWEPRRQLSLLVSTNEG